MEEQNQGRQQNPVDQNERQQDEQSQQEIGRLRQVRRDKLKELQEAGADPFQIVKFQRDSGSFCRVGR